ncbi:hypothetical protein [Undibacterium flavidum]|uniref:Uncharacterized protein n=1 Tax=Undibacterium flavidum TaxID=2762297 RepID=A0ABR6Y8D5_9BURK|nr:hypothetical protein [Undibacterium flavidum]MBC3872867.1 hypothetical protein [Undibacterium flavidum]
MKLNSKIITLGAILSVSLPVLAYQGLIENRLIEGQAMVSTKQALQKREPAGLRAAAELGLRKFVAELNEGEDPNSIPSNYPFSVESISQMKQATLDFAFEVFTTNPNNISNSSAPFDRMLAGTGNWKVIVMVDKKPVGLIDLVSENGKWEVRSAGAAKTAEKVAALAKSHSGGDAFRFVRIHAASADFLETKANSGEFKYVPLSSDTTLIGLSKNALNEKEETREKSSSEVLTQLKAAVARSSKSNNQ